MNHRGLEGLEVPYPLEDLGTLEYLEHLDLKRQADGHFEGFCNTDDLTSLNV